MGEEHGKPIVRKGKKKKEPPEVPYGMQIALSLMEQALHDGDVSQQTQMTLQDGLQVTKLTETVGQSRQQLGCNYRVMLGSPEFQRR